MFSTLLAQGSSGMFLACQVRLAEQRLVFCPFLSFVTAQSIWPGPPLVASPMQQPGITCDITCHETYFDCPNLAAVHACMHGLLYACSMSTRSVRRTFARALHHTFSVGRGYSKTCCDGSHSLRYVMLSKQCNCIGMLLLVPAGYRYNHRKVQLILVRPFFSSHAAATATATPA